MKQLKQIFGKVKYSHIWNLFLSINFQSYNFFLLFYLFCSSVSFVMMLDIKALISKHVFRYITFYCVSFSLVSFQLFLQLLLWTTTANLLNILIERTLGFWLKLNFSFFSLMIFFHLLSYPLLRQQLSTFYSYQFKSCPTKQQLLSPRRKF